MGKEFHKKSIKINFDAKFLAECNTTLFDNHPLYETHPIKLII